MQRQEVPFCSQYCKSCADLSRRKVPLNSASLTSKKTHTYKIWWHETSHSLKEEDRHVSLNIASWGGGSQKAPFSLPRTPCRPKDLQHLRRGDQNPPNHDDVVKTASGRFHAVFACTPATAATTKNAIAAS